MDKPKPRPRLLFICLSFTSFVQDDLEILKEHYDVRVFQFDANQFSTKSGRLFGLIYYGIKQFTWLLRELPRADLVYGWFADYHLVLPVLLAHWYEVPVVVPIAGLDAIRLPELGYGVYDSSWRRPLAQLVIRGASLLLPVSETMIFSENHYSGYPDVLQNGVRAHVPDFQTPYEVIPFGYDPQSWPAGPDERPPIVCTVGFMNTDRTLRRKGVDLLFEAARQMPNVTFQVVGVPASRARAIQSRYDPPENVALLPPRPRTELTAIYGNASVYAQLSRAEGMPNVLSEAMCSGCIPVGSAVFGIPEVIGDAGFIVETPEPEVIAKTLRQALDAASSQARYKARQRIVEHFPRDRRRRELMDTLQTLTGTKARSSFP